MIIFIFLTAGKGPGDRQQQIIRELKDKLKYEQEKNKDIEKDVKQVLYIQINISF